MIDSRIGAETICFLLPTRDSKDNGRVINQKARCAAREDANWQSLTEYPWNESAGTVAVLSRYNQVSVGKLSAQARCLDLYPIGNNGGVRPLTNGSYGSASREAFVEPGT